MAKTQTASTISPSRFGVGHGIYESDLQSVAEMLNYAYGYGGVTNLVGTVSGLSQWGSSSSEVQTHAVLFETAPGLTTVYRGRIWIDEDVVQLHLRSRAWFAASNDGRCRFTVGSTFSEHLYSAGGFTTATSTLNTSSTGTGWQTFTVQTNHTLGSDPNNRLERWRIRTQPITSSLPDP